MVRQWQNLANQVNETKVGKITQTKTPEQEQLADANALVEDLRRLTKQVAEQQGEIARARREKLMPADDAKKEINRLDDLSAKVQVALASAIAATADKSARPPRRTQAEAFER